MGINMNKPGAAAFPVIRFPVSSEHYSTILVAFLGALMVKGKQFFPFRKITIWFSLELTFLVQLFSIKQHCEEATVNLLNDPLLCFFPPSVQKNVIP